MRPPTEPLRSEVRIAAPPEIVFPYFTDPARMTDWMGIAALLDPRLTLLHHGLTGRGRDAHAEGWAHYLGRLAPVAAGRPAQPDPWIVND